MTREEAIAILRKGTMFKPTLENQDYPEAFKMAIKALEQEPYEDCISRRAVNILVDELARAISDERCRILRGRSTASIMQDILDLPSVQLKEDILDKIRAEIETIKISGMIDANTTYVRSPEQIKNIAIEIIDKYREQKAETDILDKIKSEIKQASCKIENDYDHGRNYGLYIATQIIDEYKER